MRFGTHEGMVSLLADRIGLSEAAYRKYTATVNCLSDTLSCEKRRKAQKCILFYALNKDVLQIIIMQFRELFLDSLNQFVIDDL